MRHPFDLDPKDDELNFCRNQTTPQDLEFEEAVSPSEAEWVGGGLSFTTLALGEEGGRPFSPPQ
jgi:hypothetical protein